MNAKKWIVYFICICGATLLSMVILTIIVDPYFHYHKPLESVSYELNNERYMNDGIGRYFDYDAIIIGTSMTHNFKTTEFDELFGAKSIKTPYAGAGYKELSESLERALARNEEVTQVLWAVDYAGLTEPSDWSRYEEQPLYLYDDNYLNDVQYLLNKSVLYHGVLNNIVRTMAGEGSTTFDEYSSFSDPLGDEGVVNNTVIETVTKKQESITENELDTVYTTITDNLLSVINRYPDTTFYIFFPPYHVSWWYFKAEEGRINVMLDAEKKAIELLLECPNVELYCFFDNYSLVCNGDNYGDSLHYSAEVNSNILQWIREGTGRITKENYEEHVEATREFYLDYLFEEE